MASIAAVGCGAHEQNRPRATTTPRLRVIVGSGGLVEIGAGRSAVPRLRRPRHADRRAGGRFRRRQLQLAGRAAAARAHHTDLCLRPRRARQQRRAARCARRARRDRRPAGSARWCPHRPALRACWSLLRRAAGATVRGRPPEEIAGVVLVDAMVRDQTRRQLAIWPRSQARTRRREVATRVRDGVDLAAGEALAGRIRSLGDMRLAVITAGRHDAEWGTSPASSLGRSIDNGRRCRTSLPPCPATTCTSSRCAAITSSRASTDSRGSSWPRCRPLVRSARAGRPLPPCRRLFSGADVACRS